MWGVVSLVLCVLATVGVFIEIPIISYYAYWVLLLAYLILFYVWIRGPTIYHSARPW
jgi:hypothetical protein